MRDDHKVVEPHFEKRKRLGIHDDAGRRQRSINRLKNKQCLEQ